MFIFLIFVDKIDIILDPSHYLLFMIFNIDDTGKNNFFIEMIKIIQIFITQLGNITV
jgi:hypothetical protein